ncbi:MAG: sigma-54-dependent Fis family transcriptional regulator [bacterium]|nr:sigma-54-dependent Fis family transcriptional regulator [bacterium]
MSTLSTILIVDDEVRSLESLKRNLSGDFDVKTAANVKEAQAILESEWVKIILCDQRMPDMLGVEFLITVRERWPDVIRIIISGYSEAEDIISGVNDAGIYQYITKPWHPDSLKLMLRNAERIYDLQRQNELMAVELKMATRDAEKTVRSRKERLRDHYSCDSGIIRADDSPMNNICDTLHQLATYDISVVITGESGTGKELAARTLHYSSLRWNKPFVAENCGAFPDELLESELFGHKKGAFTGATENHIGLFERADGGTVFLDEIGEVSESFQVKLLRVLQEGEIRPVGSTQKRKVDIRVLAATNKDLEAEIRAGRFREDLYFRLAAVTIDIPPLKERTMDIPVLAAFILDEAQKHFGKNVKGFTHEAIDRMMAYHWPGNVREMQNEIQHMLVMGPEGELLGAELLSPRVLGGSLAKQDVGMMSLINLKGTLKERVEQLEAQIIHKILIRNRWNKSRAARELGLSRVGLRGKMERYGLMKGEPADTQDA